MRLTFMAVLLLVGIACASRPAAATPIFLIDTDIGPPTVIFRVDPANGHLTALGTVPSGFGEALGLAAASDALLYVATQSGELLAVTVSPFSYGSIGFIGPSNIVGLAYSPTDGVLYAVDQTTSELSRFQVSPFSHTVIGQVHVGSLAGPVLAVQGGDLAQDAAGTWYLWTNSTEDLYLLDVTTGVATEIDPSTAGLGAKSGLAFDYQGGGTLLASSGALDLLATLDPATGATVTSVSLCVNCPTVFEHRFGDLASPRCTDGDRDGFSPEGDVCGPVDCNDADPLVHPGAAERCNGADDDCDGAVDEEPDASAACATACNATAQCVSGACQTTPRVCDDGNPCTSNSCDPVLGCQFVPQPDGLSCSDGNVCTGEEVCLGGSCADGPDLDCDDGNSCTVDSCTPPNGCRNTPVPGCCTTDADCTDTSACTIHERCAGGLCLSDPVPCDDGNPCTNDSCNPAVGCVNIAIVNGVSCGDANVCNGLETCQGGVCSPGAALDCDDGNACTVDGCNPSSGCTQQQLPGCCTADADCADTSACTINERCVNHACASDPLPCDDGNPCTSDSCNPATGCVATPAPNGQSCGDLDFCNGIERCEGGACVGGPAPSCDDGNPCTVDGCNSSVGCTHTAVPGCCFADADCLDSDACTIDEHCVTGSCTSTPRGCDDGNPCTLDTCMPAAGCVHTPLLDGTSCADANACDGVEVCGGGSCLAGMPPDCDDRNFCTTDSCDNATGCRHAPVNGCCSTDADCADTDQCTMNERCTAQHGCASTPRSCDDGNPCTLDTCDPGAGCQHAPLNGGACDDGDRCTAGDACSAGACAGQPIDCSDRDLCNGLETCVPATGACRPAAGPMLCAPGSRAEDKTCAAEWFVDDPNNPDGATGRVQSCRDGDASCDHDLDPTTCTLHVALCFRVPDPRLVPSCTPSDVAGFRLRQPSARRDPSAAAAMLAAIGTLPGATIDPRLPRAIAFSPPLSAVRCTAEVPLVVPLLGTKRLSGRTTTAGGSVDADSIRLRCLAP